VYRVARYDGLAWWPLGAGLSERVRALTVLPNGDLIAASGGTFARWDGATWSPVGAGATLANLPGSVQAMTFLGNGDLVTAGRFSVVDGVVAPHLAKLQSTCRAGATTEPAGCAGSAPVLTAENLPWAGGTFRATCAGMTSSSFAIAVVGAGPSPSLLLSALHPAGAAGCRLVSGLDLLLALQAANGIAPVRLPIPRSSALVGSVVRCQVLEGELDSHQSLARLSASNGLALVIGTW
jgi:hypothetical protein